MTVTNRNISHCYAGKRCAADSFSNQRDIFRFRLEKA